MKIAIISSTFFPRLGGAEMVMHNLATALVQAGHTVHMVVPNSERLKDFNPQYTVAPLIIPRGSVRLNMLEYVMAINLVYLQWKYAFDLWQVFVTFPPGYAAAIAQRVVKVPFVISATGKDIQVMPEIGYGLRLDPKVDKKVRIAVTRANAVVSINDGMTDAYMDAGAQKESVLFIPNGIWYDRFRAAAAKRDNLRNTLCVELGIPQESSILLCTARNHPKKNYPTLLQAAQRLEAEGVDFHLIIAGAETQKLEVLVKELGLSRRVHLLGTYPKNFGSFDELPPQELVDLYVSADMFVLPTFIEGMPLVLLEAMAAGLPIVSTDVEGVNHIVRSDHNGVLINDPTDVEAFSTAIRSVITDRGLRERLIQNALSTAQEYNWTNVVKEFEALYEQVLRK